MSSVDITSTNDVTSTSAASTTVNSFSTDAARHVTHTLTTDAIIRECIKQGFYRNPICNEKLYLHNRGFDSISPTAFEPYTDVKVLWLEGNGFSVLPCGAAYAQVQPPVRVDPFAEVLGNEEEKEGQTGRHAEHHVDPSSLDKVLVETRVLPLPADVPVEQRDAFSSLYPTVRQLYLHNNLFRSMPDLSRFQRLDSVNLSGNFFTTVESHCIYWDAKRAANANDHQQKEDEENSSTNDARKEGNDQRCTEVSEDVALALSASDAKAKRTAQLESYRRLADDFAVLCEHRPIPEREEQPSVLDTQGRPVLCAASYVPRQPPMPDPEYRNPCSSLRNLNVAGNRLETFQDCLGLLSYKALAVLDLSHNNIVDGEALLFILERLPRLQSLKLSGNPLVRTLPRYRKRLLSRCKKLVYLDDRPVFEEERRLVTAWARAGDDGEEKERCLIQQEKAAAEKKRLDDFRRLIARHHDDSNHDAPHADYVHAVTTSAALSAAADTAVPATETKTATAGHMRGTPVHQPLSDPDNSPTSSETDDGGHGDVNEGHSGASGKETASTAIAPALEDTNILARQRPSHDTPTRVLSSNQRITPEAAAAGEDDEDTDDIFVFPSRRCFDVEETPPCDVGDIGSRGYN